MMIGFVESFVIVAIENCEKKLIERKKPIERGETIEKNRGKKTGRKEKAPERHRKEKGYDSTTSQASSGSSSLASQLRGRSYFFYPFAFLVTTASH